jgi:hypothetical protein
LTFWKDWLEKTVNVIYFSYAFDYIWKFWPKQQGLVRVMVFNVTFNNISVMSWKSVLLVEEARVHRENHWPVTSHWQTLSYNVVFEYTLLHQSNNFKVYTVILNYIYIDQFIQINQTRFLHVWSEIKCNRKQYLVTPKIKKVHILDKVATEILNTLYMLSNLTGWEVPKIIVGV